MSMNRRDFLRTGSLATLAVGAGARTRIALANPEAATDNVLVFVYLRGGIDGLSLVAPIAGEVRAQYEQARVATRIPAAGANGALALGSSGWGLHPRATGLHGLFQANRLAVVHAVGMIHEPVTRSHFEAQAFMEYGLNGQAGTQGWLTRHLISGGLPGNVAIPSVSAGAITSTSLLASTETITMASGGDFRLDTGSWNWNSIDRGTNPPGFQGFVEVLPQLWQGTDVLERKGRQAHDALALIRPIDFGAYAPANGASYPSGALGDQLKMLANLIKRQEMGLRIASVDFGGWDTHNGQGNPTQGYDYFGIKVTEFSNALTAFYTDLNGAGAANHAARVSVIVLSEFGRRVLENDAGGTDHGFGNMALALGGPVNGGVYGSFPGLGTSQLFERADVGVTTDYRQILCECLIRRLGNPYLSHVFPGLSTYTPLGLFGDATGLTPNWDGFDRLFANGFEAA